jgi:hypothetical protein
VTSIGPSSPLATYLRGQLSALRPAAPADAARAQHLPGLRHGKPTAQAGPSREDLATTIARRVAVIGKDDPDRRRKAFRIFLESLMLDEWGAQLLNDPGFQQLVDTVQAQMESSADLRGMMDEASDRLLGPEAR